MEQTYGITNAGPCRARLLPWPWRSGRHTRRGPARDPGPILLAVLAVLAVAGCSAAAPTPEPDSPGESGEPESSVPVAPQPDIAPVVSAVTVGEAAGEARTGGLPGPSGGPAVLVSGNAVFAAGGTIFLDVEPESGAAVDKLLVAVGGASPGHLEFDVADAAAPYRLRGNVPFDVDAAIDASCVPVAAVDAGGAVGPVNCHRMSNAAVAFGEVQVTLSWDSEADLDLHVVDPAGDEIYSGARDAGNGGVLDFDSHCSAPDPRPFRTEHAAWSRGTPPAGSYVVRVNHRDNCGAEQTNYVARVYNHGGVSSFSGTFTGPGEGGGIGAGIEIAEFEVGDSAATPTPPPGTPAPAPLPGTPGVHTSFRYRGHGDQVFVINPGGAPIGGTTVSLDLGSATAEVYVIATNTADGTANPEVRRLPPPQTAARGMKGSEQDEYRPPPRPALSAPAPERAWIGAFNNSGPLPRGTATTSARLRAWPRPEAVEGDTLAFQDQTGPNTLTSVTATARSVVTDGSTTATVWVADADFGTDCSGAGPCVTSAMVEAVAGRFLSSGAGNDIYDWVTGIFGDPWGPHGNASLIPPDAADHIHILVFDIGSDGAPQPGQCRIGGYFSRVHNYRKDPYEPATAASAERLIFFMDSAILAIAEGPTWEITDHSPSIFISVLAHEFQHMIHFYQKRVRHGATSHSWLNEMASEVAEDLVAENLKVNGPRGVAYDDPTAGSSGTGGGRLPIYNLFNDVGVTTWNGRLANYSIVYAMGAYLARSYGGAELFSDIVQNNKSGVDAVEAALTGLGHRVSFADALADWGVAVLLSDDTGAPAPYRYNPGAWTTSSAGGEQFRLGSINLYNYRFEPPDPLPACTGPQLAGRSTQVGPYLHSLQTLNALTQPPHSNAFATLGHNTGTVRLAVNAARDNRITVVVKE